VLAAKCGDCFLFNDVTPLVEGHNTHLHDEKNIVFSHTLWH